jgi:hypothetical protein
MCKEMPVIPVNKVLDPKRIIGKKWRAEEEERHMGLLTPPPKRKKVIYKTLPKENSSNLVTLTGMLIRQGVEPSLWLHSTLLEI